MQELLFALTLSALPVASNFMGAMIAEALPLSKQTLGLALHAAGGVLLAIAATELLPQVVSAQPVWTTILALFMGGAFYVWVNQLLNLSKNRLRGIDGNKAAWAIFLSI
ncbi:MAG: zinc/iron permease, partial [Leptolyngbyaceae cyanobacterium CAN_BIN12]|nr:zinc/iron permease [Leptolyngbyaceae cyanobacterium CAN_BIN12]